MKTLDEVRANLLAGEFDFSHHAFRRAVERNVSEQEIREAGAVAAEIQVRIVTLYEPSAGDWEDYARRR